MIRWITQLWLGSAPVEFESSFGLSESVKRLRAATRRSVFSVFAQQEAVGTVTESRVSLQRVIPMVGNSFKPFFRGRFVERTGKIILTGRFTMHWLVKLFMAFWFGFCACFVLLSLTKVALGSLNAMSLTFGGLGMIAFGTALVWVGKWLSRNDRSWLSQVICSALGPPVPVQAYSADNAAPLPAIQRTTPRAIMLVTIFLVIMGVISLAGAIFGISSVQTSRSGGVAARYVVSEYSRCVDAALGAAMLLLAYNIYRRRLLAWRAGIVLLAASWFYSVADVLLARNIHTNKFGPIFFCVAGLLVTAFWIRWWYAQRVHFQD